MNPTIRANIKPGLRVLAVEKQDQGTGKTTEGDVEDILTNSPTHPHGIKVRLEGGAVGRVKQIVDHGRRCRRASATEGDCTPSGSVSSPRLSRCRVVFLAMNGIRSASRTVSG